MLQLITSLRKLSIVLMGSVMLALPVSQSLAHDNPSLATARAKSEKCVEPTEKMRVHHMDMILHQRDETMFKGIRTKNHSLKECINCHVPENRNIKYGDKEHFCSSCHMQAAVHIDCFECHAQQPGHVPKPLDAVLKSSSDMTEASESGAENE